MKHILAYILLIANLSSGLAFAWDTHPEAMVGHDSAAVNLVDDDHDHPDGDLHHEDHCCHGAAHLMGIPPVAEHAFENGRQSAFASLNYSLPLPYIAPHLRPPRA